MAARSDVVVIPVYNHGDAIAAMVDGVRGHGLPMILVDDGSDAACATVLDALAASDDAIDLVRLSTNQGKGGAMIAGFHRALQLGYSHVLQIDADGQHDSNDIPIFLEQSRQHPAAVICGCPVFDASVPKSRLYGRYATHVWVWINTWSFAITDSMCGFRVYPLQPVLKLIDEVRIGRRMDFDVEIMVRLYWRGVAIVNQPTRVRYPTDGVSHFKLLHDNVRITAMHTRLFFGMLLRAPLLLWRKLSR